MTPVLGADQRELQAATREFFTDLHDEAALRRAMASDPGWDPVLWRRLADQLGAQGMASPEAWGGGGFTHVDLGLVLEEAGAALYAGPLLSTVLVADVVAAGDAALSEEVVPRLAAKAAPAAVAITEAAGGWFADPTTMAVRGGDGWSLSGRKVHVVDGSSAELLLVSAATDTADGAPGLFVVESGDPGVRVTAVPTLDPTRRQATVELDGAAGRPLAGHRGGDDDGAALLRRLRATGAILLAAEQVGGAARALALAVEYSRTREQYGRAIGSFQALKHLCADLLTRVETARSAALSGLAALDGARADELDDLSCAAKVFCSETYTEVAAACIQIHGGIGFTWEHPAHFYYKRARASEMLFGTPSAHRAVLAARLGL